MYSTHIKGKSVVAKRLIKALKGKIYKSNLIYLNKLVDKYNDSYHYSICKEPINSDYSALSKETEINPALTQFKNVDIFRITNYQNVLVKVTLKIGQKKYLSFNLCWKLTLVWNVYLYVMYI